MRFYPQERIALFVDGPNFWEATKAVDIDPDFGKLLAYFAKQATLVGAFYFTPMDDAKVEFTPLRPLVDWLSYNGWTVTTRNKDTDVDLAVAMLELAPSIDHIVLASADSDFQSAVVAVQRMGKRVTVLASLNNCSDDLRRQANEFIDISDLRGAITREDRKKMVRA